MCKVISTMQRIERLPCWGRMRVTIEAKEAIFGWRLLAVNAVRRWERGRDGW